eukprot:7261945-Pyramimonas_sp.AAC.1
MELLFVTSCVWPTAANSIRLESTSSSCAMAATRSAKASFTGAIINPFRTCTEIGAAVTKGCVSCTASPDGKQLEPKMAVGQRKCSLWANQNVLSLASASSALAEPKDGKNK